MAVASSRPSTDDEPALNSNFPPPPVRRIASTDGVAVALHELGGDPSAALLEVLDPEQNGTFRDNSLGVPFDLSKVFFLGTANVLDTIPGPLLDRMELLRLDGYTEAEKVFIANRYLLPRQIEHAGLRADEVVVADDRIGSIIRGYTREAGVRNLEREIGKVFRSVAVRIAEGTITRMTVNAADLHEILGAPKFENEVAMRVSVPGVATGLAWTPVGGDILFIEATAMRGGKKIRLRLTGQLGDVMRESGQAALSYARSRAAALGLDKWFYRDIDIHVHVYEIGRAHV